MWLVVPIKSLAQSKQRLAHVLSTEQRQQLAIAMLKDVLAAAINTPAIQHILVVTSDKTIAGIVSDPRVQILIEPANCQGLNDAVAFGVNHAELNGAVRVLVLHGDIPLANSKDLSWLAATHLEGGITMVTDSSGSGTNGLLFDLPTEMTFHYGPDSYSKHLQVAARLGMVCNIAKLPDLTLDIDSPEDLLELSERVADVPELATARCLMQSDILPAIIRNRAS